MNVKVDFDNIVVKEDKNDFNVKVLMLKGEKGDKGDGEPNVIEKVQVNGTNLPVTNKTVNVPVPTVDSTLSSSSTNPVQNNTIYNALSNKVDTSALGNYYEVSETDALLKEKPYCFENVSYMKAEDLPEGVCVITRGYYSSGDGGDAKYVIKTSSNSYYETLDNGLVAELISDINNVLCYGVSLTDENNNNNQIIQNVINTYSYAYCNKSFTLHNPIEITTNNSHFKFNKITYDGDNVAIILNGMNIVLDGINIISSNDCLKIGKSNVTANCNVTLNRLNAENNAIVLGGTSGTLNSYLNIGRIEYKNHGMFFDLNSSYVGQVALYNSVFADTSSLSENFAIYMDCSNNGVTGLDLYNISFESTKGGIYVTTTGTTTSKFIEHLNVYGCRISELSLNNQLKAVKLVSPVGNLTVGGEFHFDACRTSAFDLSEYNSSNQQFYKLVGKMQDIEMADYMGGVALIGKEGTFVNKKLVITKPYYDYFNQTITNKEYIIPNAKNLIISGNGTAKIKFNPSDFSLNGQYFIYNNSANITQLDIINNNGTTVRSYTGLTGAETFMIECNNFRGSTTTQMNITKFLPATTRQIDVQ